MYQSKQFQLVPATLSANRSTLERQEHGEQQKSS